MELIDKKYKQNENFVFRQIEDETILVPIKNHVGDLDSLFSLNLVGAFIWRQIDGSNSLAAIHDLILAEFDVKAEKAEADLLKFITELREIGAVQPVGEKGA
jgi:hypothetical protein